MAGLFGKAKSTINEGELLEKHSMQKFGNSIKVTDKSSNDISPNKPSNGVGY